jgi:hypothetical protein
MEQNKNRRLHVMSDILKNYEIKKSDIHGRGSFATTDFEAGEFINVAIIGAKTTNFGAFLNHSDSPNAVTKKGETSYQTYALNSITESDEITVDYTVNKDLEQPEKGWRLYQEATPNNGVWTGERPKGEDETITALYKNSVSQGKNPKVEIDDDVEESTTANQPNPGFAMGVDKSPNDSYLNLLKKSVKPKKIVINITKNDLKADPTNQVH